MDIAGSLLLAIALMLIIEGMFPFVFPSAWRDTFRKIVGTPAATDPHRRTDRDGAGADTAIYRHLKARAVRVAIGAGRASRPAGAAAKPTACACMHQHAPSIAARHSLSITGAARRRAHRRRTVSMSTWLLPENIADVLPSEARKIEELRRHLLDRFRVYGYEMVMPPLLEYLESLLTGGGQDLNLRTFKLVDQLSGRTLGLRADMTPQVARIDAHLAEPSGRDAFVLRRQRRCIRVRAACTPRASRSRSARKSTVTRGSKRTSKSSS
jgi:hypothetical protein